MPMSLITTVGDPAANSYTSQLEFVQYIAVRFPPIAWALAASQLVPPVLSPANGPASDLLNATLIAAARELDNCFRWNGTVDAITFPNQVRAHPRKGLLTRNGQPLDPASIAVDLKNAQCEFALQLNVSDLLGDIQQLKQHVASVKAGSVQVNFQQHLMATNDYAELDVRMRGPAFNAVSNVVPDEVRRLLVPSWYRMPHVRRNVIVGVFTGSGRYHHLGELDGDDD